MVNVLFSIDIKVKVYRNILNLLPIFAKENFTQRERGIFYTFEMVFVTIEQKGMP